MITEDGGLARLALDVALQLAAIAISAAFGLMVLVGGPQRAPNLTLAAFLFLIAGNQATESLRRFIAPATDSPWYHLGAVFAALDPFLLYYLLSIYPSRNALYRGLPLGAVALASFALALAAGWRNPLGVSEADLWVATSVLAGSVYTTLFVALARGLRREPAEPALRLLVPAMAIAAIPSWGRMLEALHSFARWHGVALPVALPPIALLGLGIAVASVVAFAARAPLLSRRALLGGAIAGSLLLLGPALRFAASAGALRVPPADLHPIAWGSVALRWTAFGLLMSMAVLRHDMLGMSIAARRRAARVVVAALILSPAALALFVARAALPDGLGLSVTEIVVLGAVLAVSRSFRKLVDRVASKVYGVPVPGDTAAALDAYRAGALAVARAGRDPGADAGLHRLRDELGLDRRSASVVEALAGETLALPLGEGRLVGGRYRVVRALGRGGQGQAYLARDERLQRDVVIKELRGAAASASALREARAASGSSHPNVVTVHDVLDQPGGAILVTEYVSGGTLEDRVRERGKLAAEEGCAILDGVLAGLSSVHARGIAHGDLKPSNVLLHPDGHPKVADFGLARGSDESTVERPLGVLRGTIAFMAPEQRRGEPATPASDVHAAALLARRCVEGPLAPAVEAVLARAEAPEPAERFRDAGAMRAALGRARGAP